MREYDDYSDEGIRLYTPVLQRVIILAAVIIAVPVMMWTITTFVRSYVARPKVPLLEHAASTAAPARIPLIAPPPRPAPPAADQSAARGDGAAASDASNPAAEIRTGAANALADSSPPPAAATGPSTASLQAPPMQVPSPPAPVTAGDPSMANPTAAAAATTGSTSRPPQAPRSIDNAAPPSVSGSADRGIAWPNPNATNPPDFAAPRLAPPPPPPARTAAAEILPTDDPIRGRVPLPRQRPGTFAVAATMAASTSAGGPVPLPRVRPGDAPAADTGTVVEIPAGGRSELENAH
jgi:hypothetical protein